jgi:two-component system nitrogen regulation sensor histidine kinase GlnL
MLADRTETVRATAFDLSPAPSLVFGVDGRLAIANEAAERLLGQAIGHLRRYPIVTVLAPDSELVALLTRAIADRTPASGRNLDVELPETPLLHVDAWAGPLPDGRLQLVLAPRSAGPLADRAADTLRSVAGMGRTLAHEIKNPLAGIRGAAQLLSAGATTEDAGLAQLIVDETDRIRRLIDRVEAFSDEREPSRTPVNLHRILDRVRVLMAAGIGERLVFRESYDPSLPHAWGDEDQLIQVFLNLVKNAVEAAGLRPDGAGEVTIATRYRHDSPTAPLEVRVQDNGPGIAPGLKDRLFHPFVTTKPTGAGLGLTLVAKLVADHNGLIDVESEPGRTVFRVLVPRQRTNRPTRHEEPRA